MAAGDSTLLPPSLALVKRRIAMALRRDLAAIIIPELRSQEAAVTAQLFISLLDFLAEDDDGLAPSLCGRTGLSESLIEKLVSLSGTDETALNPDMQSIERIMAELFSRPGFPAARALEADFIQALVSAEEDTIAKLDAQTLQGATDPYGQGQAGKAALKDAPAPKIVLTAELLTTYIRTTDLFGPHATVTSLANILGGFNKHTTSFTIECAGKSEQLIMRRDAAPNPTGFSVADEYPLLTKLWQIGGLPIAEPLLLETDVTVAGAPFMITRRVEGSSTNNAWRADPAARLEFGRLLAGTLAKLHAIDIGKLLPEGAEIGSAYDRTAAEIDRWYRKWQGWRLGPNPAVEAAYAWMKANIPRSSHPPCLVHGDVGFHNMLILNGKLTALLDWEFSHIGDPMEDINYCRQFVEQVLPWDDFIAMYHAAGGVTFDPASETFFRLWPDLRNGSGCTGLLKEFLKNSQANLMLAVAGAQHARRYETVALRTIAG
jgi:aminoglycoside phosphotransferase (APT) family kinase protein